MNRLGEPFGVSTEFDTSIDELDDSSSAESSPLVHKTKQELPKQDFQYLASANFSTDSIAEVDEKSDSSVPSTPVLSNNGILNLGHGRRLSVSSLNSPTQLMRPHSSTKPRPKSAFFGDESFKYDESPYPNPNISSNSITSPITRNHRRNYIPPPIVAPSYSSRSGSPTRSTSPTRANRHFRSKSPVRRGSSPTKLYQPFNFQPQEMSMNNNHLSVKPAHRKGHKYKHSSVSMNLFQEPSVPSFKTDNVSTIPDLYPIPTLKELIASITKEQKLKLGWSVIHLCLSIIVFTSGHEIHIPELSTLAHLIFYDSLGSMVVILVEIMSNFEVWNNASLAFPFGLGRLEVLIGFGLAASLIMVGFDLLSHIFEEFVFVFFSMGESEVNHSHGGSHHVHRSDTAFVSLFVYYLVLIMTLVVTGITSNYILASKKITSIIRPTPSHNRNVSNIGIINELETSKPNKFWELLDEFTDIITKNPTYILTILYAAFLLLSPMISEFVSAQLEIDINEFASLIISLLFCLTGWRLVKALGGILLLSYPSSNYNYDKLKVSITNDITALDAFKNSYKIEKLFITKFNHDTFIVGLGLGMQGGSIDDEARLRFEITRLITKKIGRRERNKFKLEITIDIDRI